MTIEDIATVLGDLSEGRARDPYDIGLYRDEVQLLNKAVAVDVSSINEMIITQDIAVDIYDVIAAPPWRNSIFVFQNHTGNVVAVHSIVTSSPGNDPEDPTTDDGLWWDQDSQYQPKNVEHSIDWDEVRWVLSGVVWVGGRSQEDRGRLPTSGPHMMWTLPLGADGRAQDIRWTNCDVTGKVSNELWNGTLAVWLYSLNFLNCANVHAAVPERPRAERRRVERASRGVEIHELVVTPKGRKPSARHAQPLVRSDLPAHSVRGHFSEYGVNGKGLLFGKHSGRFWVPQHVRGSIEHGEIEQRFTLLREKEIT